MKLSFLHLSLLNLASLINVSANAQEAIKVDVDTNATRGQLILSLCTEETFLQDTCTLARTIVSISDQATTITLIPPRPGRYAVLVVYDKNSNGKMDKNFLGVPKEPVGLSRNPTAPKFGPPKFSDAAFEYPSSKPLEFRIRLVSLD
jgi:uncharacterized protein (DUF2141 family)